MNIDWAFKTLTVCAMLMMVGCASVDFDYPKTESYALTEGVEETYFYREMADVRELHEDSNESGFLLMQDGVEAFALRLLLAEHAEKTLDAQYYLITNDTIGYAFIGSLLKTADRGVRVRLLLDDIQTAGYDAGMWALDSHPNFEVRIFNPFASRNVRAMDAFAFNRVNRRMHNKSFTVDNQLTIIGGRNIADEYFGARSDVNFGDVDVMGVGPVVQDVSNMFDLYWNSDAALPVQAFAEMPQDPEAMLVKLRERIDEVLEGARDGIYAQALKKDYDHYLEESNDIFEWAPYELAYDSPDKADKKKAETADSIKTTLHAAIQQAEKEFFLISPYFVPLKSGEVYFQELVDRGVNVIVVTNSLAANNHGIVHSGYMGSRKRLLKMGVKLYEVKALGAWKGYDKTGNEDARATLHTKAFLVDRKGLFIGSFNWDPRSMNINTELGVIINSASLGAAATEQIEETLATQAYEVVLDENDNLRWLDKSGDKVMVHDKEPDTSWWKRFTTGFMRILPGKSQL